MHSLVKIAALGFLVLLAACGRHTGHNKVADGMLVIETQMDYSQKWHTDLKKPTPGHPGHVVGLYRGHVILNVYRKFDGHHGVMFLIVGPGPLMVVEEGVCDDEKSLSSCDLLPAERWKTLYDKALALAKKADPTI